MSEVTIETLQTELNQANNNIKGLVAQLDASKGMLNDSFAFEFFPSESAINKKTQKVSHYLEYSKQLGMVQ